MTTTTITGYEDDDTQPIQTISTARNGDTQPIEAQPMERMTTSTTAETSTTASPVASYRAGLDHVRFWVGVGLTAVITAVAAVIGLLLINGVLRVPVLITSSHPLDAGAYVLLTAAIAIAAAALYNLMLHVAPHPTTYYGALAAVGIALAVLLPFTVPVALVSQAALAGLNLVIGLLIAFLVPLAAVTASR
jgi:hypothetical protein